MGNWRTVHIIGTCGEADVEALRVALDSGPEHLNHHCLNGSLGICALPNWATEDIWAVGNLAERNYSVQAVATQLEKLAAIAPTLAVEIHCGGDHEDTKVVNTVVLAEGEVTVEAPRIDTLPPVPAGQREAHMKLQMMQRGFHP